MALALRFREVLEGRSIMQNDVVVYELNIAGFKLHHQIEVRIVSELVQQIECFDLRGREWCDAGKASGRLDVLALINRRDEAVVIVEDGNSEIRFAAFGNFAPSIGFYRLHQDFE